MATLERAIDIAVTAHKGQKDKTGNPYVLHLFSVMMKGKTDEEKICGILHDLVEDTPWTFDQLRKEGFSEKIIAALECVTKKSEDENYDDFIQRILPNPLAVRVKMNDLEDNMDVRRIPELNEDALKRLNKYLKAYNLLKAHL